MVTVWIDELTPCLKNSKTGQIIKTEVIRIKRKSFLKNYSKKTGWGTDWSKLVDHCEIYALVLKGTVDIQGMIAISPSSDMQAVYVEWMCSAPNNNHQIVENPEFKGVGGHLFAIAVQKSMEYGFDGVLTGFAANEKLLKHYKKVFSAEHLGILHPYQFAIMEDESRKIMEVYDYEWTDETI